MRQLLLASTCLLALAATPAFAQTRIETATTAAVRTSTVKAGTPDDITITAPGSIATTSPVAVTIDSNHKVLNQGTISIGSIANATGILANAGVTGGITNSGTITIDEAYTPTDSDNDGDLDGPFAVGGNRFGIRTLGAFTGPVVNSGTILVEGNDSAGILLGGPLTGNLVHDGTTTVLGSNSVGVSMADVTGNVRLAGTIGARGLNAVAVRSSGNVGGAMVLQGQISASGYRSTILPADPSKLDSDDLLQGGPAVSIEGSVAGGIVLAVPPKDASTTDTDEDDDGIEDSKEGSAALASFGSAAALRIGHQSNAAAIGPVAGTGTGFGLIVEGGVLGDGVYAGVDGNAVQIGGLGGAVSIAGGIGVSGTVQARSLDRSATALRLGAGASTPELRNSGKILAGSGSGASAQAVAIEVAQGATLPVLRNSGEIAAMVGSEAGAATAIIDRSGTLALVENSGAITARGAAATSTRNLAIDLSANSAGAIVRQTAVSATHPAPTMVGDIRFGAGNDLLDIADGTHQGNVSFGLGNNRYALSGDAIASGNLLFGSASDSVTLTGTSKLSGNIDFGGGADTLALSGTSVFTGQLSNAAGLAVSVSQGTFSVRRAATIASLSITDGGTFGVLLDRTAGASTVLTVSGSASFGASSKLQLSVADIAKAEGTYTVLSAGSLTGFANLSANSDLLPFLFKGSLGNSGNAITVTIARKTAAELGLNKSESAAYSAIYTALGTERAIGDSILAIRSQEGFQSAFRQMLPNHAGGVFEVVTAGDRAVGRALHDSSSPRQRAGAMSYWVNQLAFGSSKEVGETAGFNTSGWGVNLGAEIDGEVGRIGLSLSYLWGKDGDAATRNSVIASQYGVSGHWRIQHGGFEAAARLGWAHVDFDGARHFRLGSGSTAIERMMSTNWSGRMATGSGRIAYRLRSGVLYARPSVDFDYARLVEAAHVERGGGTALDLSVAERISKETAVSGLLAAGLAFGPAPRSGSFLHLELEGGRRQIIDGSLGATVARFGTGQPFTLAPEERRSGWVGRLRALGGDRDFRVVGDLGAEQREERVAISARVTLALGL